MQKINVAPGKPGGEKIRRRVGRGGEKTAAETEKLSRSTKRVNELAIIAARLDDLVAQSISVGVTDEEEGLDTVTMATARTALESGRAALHIHLQVRRDGADVVASVSGEGGRINVAEFSLIRRGETDGRKYELPTAMKAHRDPLTSALFAHGINVVDL